MTATRIYVYSPSGAVQDKSTLHRGVKRLEKMGYEVEVDAAALSRHMRFAGDDETRLAAIERAAHSKAHITLITRGGYGLSRLLHRLPYAAIQQSIENGTQWMGFSDFTALQMAVLAHQINHAPHQVGHHPTWAGAALCEDFGVNTRTREVDDIMQACFEDLCQGIAEGCGWRLSATHKPSSNGHMGGEHVCIENALLWGGNLSVLCSLVGTPYLPAVQQGILFLEDVHEHPYRLERMLTQLLHAGVLSKQRALILGSFTSIKPVPQDRGYKLTTAVQWLQAQLNIPVLTQLPFGHVPTKVMLPIGKYVDLHVQKRDAFLFWGDEHHDDEKTAISA